MKNTRWTLLTALVLAVPTVAFAQGDGRVDTRSGSSSSSIPSSSFPGNSSGMPGGAPTGAAGDSGSITNGASTETTTTTTSTSGISPDGVSIEADPSMETTELANTGGEPVLMSLLGLTMVAGAFAMRRRVSAN